MKRFFSFFGRYLKGFRLKHILIALLIVLAAVGIGGSYYFYTKYTAIKSNPDLEAQKKTHMIVAMVGKLIELPKGENPTIATITDKTKLKDQAFFKMAENGDVLLAYTSSMQAILYRPSLNKIINVAPISTNSQQNTIQGATKDLSDHMHTVAYYNGTTSVGVASAMEKAVNDTYKDYQTVVVTNAKRSDYKETIIVDLSGTHATKANDLAQLLHGKVAVLPEGETKPNADFLVISGK